MFMEENKNEQLRIIDKLLEPDLSYSEANKLRMELCRKEKERTVARGIPYQYGKGRREQIDLTIEGYFELKRELKLDKNVADFLEISTRGLYQWKYRKGITDKQLKKA
ncbi:hypothetical protein ACRW9N_02385 [Listeria aquatica]|uniref:hypothetical protein n=1 Tax=Listeria aquatica TaxID=1494960 RepID=UPI003EFA8FA7